MRKDEAGQERRVKIRRKGDSNALITAWRVGEEGEEVTDARGKIKYKMT